MDSVKYAVIGCGSRLSHLVDLLSKYNHIELHGGWDPAEANVHAMLNAHKRNNDARAYASYQELVQDPELDWVLVGSPNVNHKDHIVAAFEHGKHVFSEKPLATTREDCIAIHEAHTNSDRLFATGFTLRYATLYRKAKEILSSGRLGKIIAIDANENITPDHGAYIMTNWRRNNELAGPHILEKCVHDFDLLNWFAESLPVRIAAFGGNNMFVPENKHLFETSSDTFDLSKWESLDAPYLSAGGNPFLSQKSIEDNVVSILEYDNGIRVQFQATMSNPIPERRMYFHCSAGNLILELYSGLLKYKSLHDEETHLLECVGGGHGDGDQNITKELCDSMLTGAIPVCGGEEGLQSTIVGISIDEARRAGKILDLRPIWEDLNVDVRM